MNTVTGPVLASVVVASHARPLRLRWLLNALEEQHLETAAWEVVVVHDYDPGTVERVIESHPLAEADKLCHIAIAPGTGSPARQRNLGWRAAHGDLVAFTDDDCRPDRCWLGHLVAGAQAHPGALVQGATRPEPYEHAVLAAPHVRTLLIEPPGTYAQTCNILYPRELLERLGGFDERAIAGEDVDLSLRARAAGRPIAPAPDATAYHAIESHSLLGIVRENLKWRHLAYLVKRHPEMRRTLPLGVFWDADHLRTAAALAGLLAGRRGRAFGLLAVPYVVHGLRRRGSGRRALAVSLLELPGQAVRQVAELVGLAVGSARHRTFVL